MSNLQEIFMVVGVAVTVGIPCGIVTGLIVAVIGKYVYER